MSHLEIKNLSFAYEERSVFKDFSLSVPEGQIQCLFGPSGSGKSTLLHLIAGFLTPAKGTISIAGENINSQPPEKRRVGMVFQEHCLFPHLTVSQNVGFGIRSGNKEEKINEYLRLVRLDQRRKSYPAELSGGECQRIAVARALAADPQILLFDEAFSSLDETLRAELRQEVRELLKKKNLTALVVTHSQSEGECFGDIVTHLES